MESVHVASKLEEARLRAAVAARVLQLAVAAYPSPLEAMRAVGQLSASLSRFEGVTGAHKTMRVDGRWRFRPMMPAFPSPAFDHWARGMLHDQRPMADRGRTLAAAMVAVTPRCPLACVHCSAAHELDDHERLSLDQLGRIVRELQAAGASNITLTGGEPLSRLDDVCALVGQAEPVSEFWLNTSGWGLTDRAAARLAEAGVAGIWLSLDSERPEEHDRFRGRHGVFAQAERAAREARAHGLAVGISTVPTPALLDGGRLDVLAALAWRWGAFALRVVTPKAVGRWEGHDVALSETEVDRLAVFADTLNGGPHRDQLPFVLSDEVIARRLGCKLAGEMSVYVDSWGQVHGCPFCVASAGSLLDTSLDAARAVLTARGCPRFTTPTAFAS